MAQIHLLDRVPLRVRQDPVGRDDKLVFPHEPAWHGQITPMLRTHEAGLRLLTFSSRTEMIVGPCHPHRLPALVLARAAWSPASVSRSVSRPPVPVVYPARWTPLACREPPQPLDLGRVPRLDPAGPPEEPTNQKTSFAALLLP
jgi:hypothetical protein